MGLWVALIAVLVLSVLGWRSILKAPWPIVGFWLALMGLYGFLLFELFFPLLAPAAGRERGHLRWAFANFLMDTLRSLGAVDAGQPRHPSEPREGPGLWLLDARSAVAVEQTGIRLVRVAGPGLARVEAGEQVAAFVDLRPQQFPQGGPSTLRIRTQDGISLGLEMRTATAFLPQNIPPTFSGRSPYFFPPQAMGWSILQALRAARVDEDRVLHWFEVPYEIARGELSIRIGNLLFDQLFLFAQPEREGRSPVAPLARLSEEIRLALSRDLHGLGMRLDRLRVTLSEVPEEARSQRVEVWRSQWASRLARWIGLAESEMLMEYARARYASQMEMLQAISEVLATDQGLSPEVILLHFLETLDSTVRQSGLTLPEELQQLWRYLRGEPLNGK
ncbi:hypothetical protein [Thermoflexus sp.]|uniref:hypothetical protein n=1 Tax=Thermoflexus sp. TaxID=1969742 RepID=UPI0025D92AF5|nr:hypothetical protein [Thermoflexus sp.]MDW8064901.1 hypothetical protein [Anaerolineae bacterium]MCS6964201.1 hypothetical protein [Thermoflexus sp.]MCS7351134.1 hypothetical protein [Thermoflexus sp.]MCX7689905.1 hypothetical protein [Thermoflexus sp.]MDW8180587.1 hypothetical protein [Anaerolineae bacterium]